ncbi:amidase [Amycolatopsis sp. WGS_07]|uniref:amidase n=1 Tax=Amycolatopsis sp. WGS_07 TaxID=3076764 RepID=UPI00387360FA
MDTVKWQYGIEEAASHIAARELSVVEYVSSVLDRLAETEPDVSAWTYVDREGALAAAQQADEEISAGRYRGPLHGIPLGVKDVIDTAGMPTEGGSKAYAGRVPAQDAAVVRTLREKGAIVLGKTVTHEIAYGQNFPPTRNPWDPTRYQGGSSAGSGVAVAVGSAPGSLGTDTSGSVRNPASVNGIVGMRPTTGLIDGAGVLNLSEQLDQIGPLARTTVDCALLLQGMAKRFGPDDIATAVRRPLNRPRAGVDLAAWHDWGVSAEVQATIKEAVNVLAAVGVEIVDIRLPELSLALPTTLVLCLADALRLHGSTLSDRPADFEPGTRVMLELGCAVTEEHLALARRARAHLRDRIRTTFLENDLTALVSPTLSGIPPRLSEMSTDLTRESDEADLSSALLLLAPSNVCGLPALSVPGGFAGGLPIGLHLLGRPYEDLALLRLAQHYESAVARPAQATLRSGR